MYPKMAYTNTNVLLTLMARNGILCTECAQNSIYLHFLTGILLSVVLINIFLHSCAQGSYIPNNYISMKNFVCLAERTDDVCTLHLTFSILIVDQFSP
jgi:hypothetical protein